MKWHWFVIFNERNFNCFQDGYDVILIDINNNSNTDDIKTSIKSTILVMTFTSILPNEYLHPNSNWWIGNMWNSIYSVADLTLDEKWYPVSCLCCYLQQMLFAFMKTKKNQMLFHWDGKKIIYESFCALIAD